jgi:hypothetical protein
MASRGFVILGRENHAGINKRQIKYLIALAFVAKKLPGVSQDGGQNQSSVQQTMNAWSIIGRHSTGACAAISYQF